MRYRWTWLLLAALAAPAAPALAGMPVSQSAKCPIGGDTFTYTATASYSIWGYRPDGKPYGSWEFPLELPKCPDNGLVLFDKFGPDEVARLKTLVGSAEYRAMLGTETNYFLAAWLMERLGREPVNVAWMLVQASWQADGRPELKARYQALYVERIRTLAKTGDGVEWLLMQGRAVNGLRELKRFDEAKALLASLDLAPLDVPIPEEEKGALLPGGHARELPNFGEVEEAKRKRRFLIYFARLGELIEAADAGAEPVRLIPTREGAERCRSARNLSQADKELCALPDMQKLIAPRAG